MRFVLLVIVSFFLYSPANGQATVSGKIFDGDGNELARVPVCLIQQKDSSTIQSVLSDDEGLYCFKNIQNGTFLVRATFLGQISSEKKVMVWRGSHLNVDLRISESVMLKEVVVTQPNVTVNGDTTRYAVNRFTSGSERNLKDILGALPNVSVDEASKSITANGKHVNRILLEGQDLFQGNTSIPLENLSADGVKRVEIIDNYSEYNIYDGFKTTNETVLNVGVDEKLKNRIKGEIDGNGGYRDKYDVRATSLYIGKKSMLHGVAASNNTGNRLLTFQDIMQFNGGVKNLLMGDDPMDEVTKLMNMYSAFTNSRRDISHRENSLVSLNGMSNPNSKVRLSIGAIYGYDHYRCRKENSYSYLSGLDYTEEARENSRQHNGLFNIKLTYTPSKNFNIIYSNQTLVATQDKENDMDVMEQNDIAFLTSPKTLHVKNNLLAAKRFGKNVLNLTFSHSVSQYKESSAFESTYTYFTPLMNLDNSYEYDYKNRNEIYAAQLFYLHRLSDSYYMRFALSGEKDKQYFTTQHRQTDTTAVYGNDSHVYYTTCYGDVMLGKDRGNLTFSIRLRYALLHSSSNIKRSFMQTNTNFLSPMLQVKYNITPYHYLMLKYECGKKKSDISDLIDNQWLKSYNQVVCSQVDRLFSPTHKVSLSHLLSLQYVGLNIMNMASYEEVKDPIVSSHFQEGYVSRIEKMQGDRERALMMMSSAEYKFLNFPLNVRCNFNFKHSYTPMYYEGVFYKSAANSTNLMLQLVTFYKRGFNGNLKWSVSNSAYTGVPMSNRLTTNNLLGQLTWHNHVIYASVDARLSTYSMNLIHTKNMYYGFEIRYNIADDIILKLSGVDVMHMKERRQMTGSNTSYSSINSNTWYMPGHIMAGISFKY